jgi:hypothetical protein
VNSSTSGAPITFSVHGLAVSADPAAVVKLGGGRNNAMLAATVAAGDFVLARGSYAAPTLTVAAPSGSLSAFATNIVIDTGVPRDKDHDGF